MHPKHIAISKLNPSFMAISRLYAHQKFHLHGILTVAFFELRWMGISSYAMHLDEYFEHNFCTGSSSNKAFGDSES